MRRYECAQEGCVTIVEHPNFPDRKFYMLPNLTLIDPETYTVIDTRGLPFDDKWVRSATGDLVLEDFSNTGFMP